MVMRSYVVPYTEMNPTGFRLSALLVGALLSAAGVGLTAVCWRLLPSFMVPGIANALHGGMLLGCAIAVYGPILVIAYFLGLSGRCPYCHANVEANVGEVRRGRVSCRDCHRLLIIGDQHLFPREYFSRLYDGAAEPAEASPDTPSARGNS